MPYYDNHIHGAFQTALGRRASDSEMDYFKKYLDNGSIQPYEIEQILSNHPEAIQSRNAQQLQQYGSIMQGQNSNILNLAAQAARGQFADLGRPDSSGLSAQVLSAGQNLAAQQAPQLANFYGQGAGLVNQAYGGLGNQAYGRAYGLTDEARQRNYQLEDYYRQKDDYNDALRGQSTRNLQSSLISAGLSLPGQLGGAMLGGWAGGKALGGLLGGGAQTALGAFYGPGKAQGGMGSSPNQYGLSSYGRKW